MDTAPWQCREDTPPKDALVTKAFLLIVSSIALLASARAAQVSVAVAANFQAPAQAIAQAFEQATGHKVVMAVGSTGRLVAQIRNGAPFQVLLAADMQGPLRLEQEGLAVKGSRFTYALGRLVLWSADPRRVDGAGQVLRRPEVQRVAVADPKLAPYGAAAMQVLERLGVAGQLRGKIVQGESIGQAYQFVATGNASLGLVAWSQVQEQGRITRGSGWLVPDMLHEPIAQQAVLLRKADGNEAAIAWLAFLRSDAARAIIRQHGYDL